MRSEVTVRVVCPLPEKLLERALGKGAAFSEVVRDGEHGLTLRCDAASAEILLKECDRFRLPAKVLARRGLSALADFAKRRATLAVGILIFAALSWLFLGRIWLIDIAFSGEAARLGDAASLRAALADSGIRPGIERGVDLERLSETLRAGAGDYSYVGAHLRGIRLEIEAVPEVPSPEVYDVAAARDLVADRDGVVVSAVARSGELCVQPGDAVLRGQLLIRGEELAATGEARETRPIAALGEVIVRTWYVGEASLPLKATRTRYTGNSGASSRLRTPWFGVSITEGARFADEIVETEILPIGGLFVPLEIERTTRREVVREAIDRDEDLLKAQLSALAFSDAALRLAREGPETCEILRRWIDYERTGDRLTARAVLEVSADAAVTRDALLNHP